MTLTEKDPELALRGRVCANLGMLPTDPRIVYSSIEELMFLDHYAQKRDEDFLYRIGKMLGVIWTKDDFIKTGVNQRRATVERVDVPILVALKPELADIIRRDFEMKQDQANVLGLSSEDTVVELGSLPKEEYQKIMQGYKNYVKD